MKHVFVKIYDEFRIWTFSFNWEIILLLLLFEMQLPFIIDVLCIFEKEQKSPQIVTQTS